MGGPWPGQGEAQPDIPLHTNGSENGIRCQVTQRKISGGTRTDKGRECRDAFLGISFWDYLGHRLAVPQSATIQPPSALIGLRRYSDRSRRLQDGDGHDKSLG